MKTREELLTEGKAHITAQKEDEAWLAICTALRLLEAYPAKSDTASAAYRRAEQALKFLMPACDQGIAKSLGPHSLRNWYE